jgi:hypothetical protein
MVWPCERREDAMGRGVAVGAPSFHGLVLGILVDLVDSGYEVKSNPASGPGGSM